MAVKPGSRVSIVAPGINFDSVRFLSALAESGYPLDPDEVLWFLQEGADDIKDKDEAAAYLEKLNELRDIIGEKDLETAIAGTFALTMWMVAGLSKRLRVKPALQARQTKAFGAHNDYLHESSRLRIANPTISTKDCAKKVRKALIKARGLPDDTRKILCVRRIEQIIALPEEMRAQL